MMRHQARTRRGGGIPPTKHRDANGGCSAREESRFSPKGATNACAVSPAPEGALRGHGRGRSGAEPSKTRRVAQDCDPTAYMYTPSGRKDALIDRLSRASTVAPTVTAHWKANQHKAPTENHHQTRSNSFTCTTASGCGRWSGGGILLRPLATARRPHAACLSQTP